MRRKGSNLLTNKRQFSSFEFRAKTQNSLLLTQNLKNTEGGLNFKKRTIELTAVFVRKNNIINT